MRFIIECSGLRKPEKPNGAVRDRRAIGGVRVIGLLEFGSADVFGECVDFLIEFDNSTLEGEYVFACVGRGVS